MSNKNFQKEADMVAMLSRLSGLKLDSSNAARKLPYASSGRKFAADAVWTPAVEGAYKGICIEIQGMGRHSRITGMANDCRKCAIAQADGWMWFCITYKADAIRPMAAQLVELSKRVIAINSASPATPGGADLDLFDPMEDV